jgi:DNA-binding transcriptional MerR regulator
MQDRFTSREVIALTSITARQLQWWDERGVVRPEREGHRRLYSMNQLTEIAVICQLRRKGFSLQGVRKVVRFLDREFGKGLAEIVDRNSETHLLTDGKHLYLETSAKQIVDILKNSNQPIFGRLFNRCCAPGSCRRDSGKGKYLSNFAGLPEAC